MRAVVLALVAGLLLVGCSSQSQHGEGPDGEPLPAPVRESSVVAPPDPDPVLVEEETELDPLTPGELGELEPAADLVAAPVINEPSTSAPETSSLPETPTVEPVSEASRTELAQSEPDNQTIAEVSAEAETEVEGLVQVALPEDVEVLAAEEASSESDVATYLLDEAENSFQRENYEKARGQAERALTLEPTAARAYLIIARVELAEGRPEQAAEMARQGLASSEDSDEIFEQLNQILGDIAEMQPKAPPIPSVVPTTAPTTTSSSIPPATTTVPAATPLVPEETSN